MYLGAKQNISASSVFGSCPGDMNCVWLEIIVRENR